MEPQQKQAPDLGGPALHVLLVDSQRHSSSDTEGLLKECGYQVTAVRTAKEALSLLEAPAATFDLLLKAHEPQSGVNAGRLLGRLAQSPALRNLPVVVASSSDDQEGVLRCLQLGAADYLVKPLRVNELRLLAPKHQAHHGPGGRAAALPLAGVALLAPTFSGGSQFTKIDDEEEDPASKSSGPDGEGGGRIDGRNSANRNSTTKAGCGLVLKGDGSNTANGHGSNNGNCVPSIYNSSGEGSGGSRGNGSGQGSGSGNEDLAAAAAAGRRLASESPALHNATAAAAAAGKAGALPSTRENGSNGNSGVGDMEGNAASAAKRDTHAQGKRMEAMPEPPLAASPARGSESQQAAPTSASLPDGAECVPSVGFRAWVGPQSASLGPSSDGGAGIARGMKRSASDAAPLGPPPARSIKPKASLHTPTVERLGSNTRTGGTGTSDGTHFGSSGALGASVTLRRNSSSNLSPKAAAQQAAVSSAMPPPLPPAPALTTSAAPCQRQSSASLTPPVSPQDGAAHPWGAANAAAMTQMRQLQTAMVQQQQQMQAQQQQQLTAQQQQLSAQQHQQQQQAAQLRNSYGSFGGMPPHMAPHPSFGGNPLGAWGNWNAAAAQAAQQAQQQHAGGANASQQPQPQAQQPFAFGPQQMMQQQMMMASYPGMMMGGMNGFMGAGMPPGFPGFQASWAQQLQSTQQQQQQQQQQQAAHMQAQAAAVAGLPPKAPQPSGAQQTARPAPADMARMAQLAQGFMALQQQPNGTAVNGRPQQQHVDPQDGCPQQHGISRAATPSTVVADSAAGEGGDDDGTGGRVPSQRERRQQALDKYKQKRKNLCFTKKIRYESRKQLAQARPRIKGQFVRVSSGAELVDAAELPLSPSLLAIAADAEDEAVYATADAPVAPDAAEGDQDAESDVTSPRATTVTETLKTRQACSFSGKAASGKAAAATATRSVGRSTEVICQAPVAVQA